MFLLAWLFSGLVLATGWGVAGNVKPVEGPVDLGVARISPEQAVAVVKREAGEGVQVHTVAIKNKFGCLLYEISTTKYPRPWRVDAATGGLFMITQDVAERLVVGVAGDGLGDVVEAKLLTKNNMEYRGVGFPVHRLVFEGDPGAAYYVDSREGIVGRRTWKNRWRYWVRDLHFFGPIKDVFGQMVRHQTQIVASVLGMASVLTGYYLVLPRRWTRNRNGE